MTDIMEIVKSLEESGLLIKGVNKTIQNGAKEENKGFLNMLLGTLGATFLINLSTGKGAVRAGELDLMKTRLDLVRNFNTT